LCLEDSLLFIGEISGDDSAAEEEEDVEDEDKEEEEKDEEGGVLNKVVGGGICKRDLSAARRATEAWSEGGSLASL